MHIDPTTHEHGRSGKVYTYEGDFDVADDEIRWHADVTQADGAPRTIDGAVPVTSPAVAGLAEQAVRDAILKRIDELDGPLTGAR